MREFEAIKKYYIHDFKAIQDWFGNRGIPIERKDLKEWAFDGDFLFFTCNETAPEEIKPDSAGDVMYCTLDNQWYECEDEMDYKKSPFANKIKGDE